MIFISLLTPFLALNHELIGFFRSIFLISLNLIFSNIKIFLLLKGYKRSFSDTNFFSIFCNQKVMFWLEKKFILLTTIYTLIKKLKIKQWKIQNLRILKDLHLKKNLIYV